MDGGRTARASTFCRTICRPASDLSPKFDPILDMPAADMSCEAELVLPIPGDFGDVAAVRVVGAIVATEFLAGVDVVGTISACCCCLRRDISIVHASTRSLT